MKTQTIKQRSIETCLGAPGLLVVGSSALFLVLFTGRKDRINRGDIACLYIFFQTSVLV